MIRAMLVLALLTACTGPQAEPQMVVDGHGIALVIPTSPGHVPRQTGDILHWTP
jgi:hypothetical protein